MISLNRFLFCGKSSIDFDLICGASFEDDNGATESFLNREAMTSTVYDGSRRNIHGYKYSEVLAPRFTLVKKDFTDFTEIENRKILAWLTSSTKAEKMVCYKDDSDVVSFVLIGNITQIEQRKITNSRVIGYEFIFEHIAPWAYSPTRTRVENITLDNQEITIYCHTDVYEKHLYPKIQVAVGDSLYLEVSEDPMADTYIMLNNTVYKYGNNIYAKVNGQKQTLSGKFDANIEQQTSDSTTYGKYYLCTTDSYIYKGVIDVNSNYAWERCNQVGRSFEIKNTYYENGKDVTVSSTVTGCQDKDVVTLDGENRVISISKPRVVGDSFNWEWLYFIPGENKITVSSGCEITFTWVEPIKIGNL